jgi:hypothetical protein
VPRDHATIQAGIDAAAPGDTVQVACGTYTDCTHVAFDGLLTCIIMKEGIVLRGEPGRPDCVTVDAEGAGRCLTFIGGREETRIEGLTFRNGDAGNHDGGGALLLGIDPTVTIADCVFQDNRTDRAGGGLACRLAAPRILRCRFVDNRAPANHVAAGGGGVSCGVSWPSFEECRFERNSAAVGAALQCESTVLGQMSITRCEFVDNQALFRGGALYLIRSDVRVVQSTFRGNQGASDAGAVMAFACTLDLRDCHFDSNFGGIGGALYLADATSSLEVHGSVLSANRAYRGGAIACVGGASPVLGACTLVANEASIAGSGVYASSASQPQLRNTIIAGSPEGEAVHCVDAASHVELTCCDVFGNVDGDWTDCIADQALLRGNLAVDPRFCDAAGRDWSVSEGSPCLPENNACGAQIGALDAGCRDEPAPLSLDAESWGSVKARYR